MPNTADKETALSEARQLPFYRAMVSRAGVDVSRPISCGEVWMLVAQLVDGLQTLAGRAKDLEDRGALSYRGVFEQGVEYRKGEFATDKGSVWHCNRTTKTRPSEGGTNWTLAVKAGRDGKDR